MSETDPFSDAAFTSRLQKLLPMLGSQQPGEAEAARRKIAEHLQHHRLSFTDLANHLRDRAPVPPRPGFSQGAREMMLERELMAVRAAKFEAESEAAAAILRVRSLEYELQQIAFDNSRNLNSQARVRGAAALACIVAVVLLIFIVLPHGVPFSNVSPAPLSAQGRSIVMTPGPEATTTGLPIRIMPGERIGTAAVQDLAIRLQPNDQASIRAFLNYGERIAIQQHIHVGPQTWLLVRSATGAGWVRSGDVLQ